MCIGLKAQYWILGKQVVLAILVSRWPGLERLKIIRIQVKGQMAQWTGKVDGGRYLNAGASLLPFHLDSSRRDHKVLLRAWIPDTALEIIDNLVTNLIVGSVLNMVYFLERECYED